MVPLSSLLSDNDAPGETADRSGCIPGETLRQHIADTLHSDRGDQVLFTRLLTDDGGRLLDTTELGRYPSTRLAEAITIRAGTCRFPTCTVPANRCDLDHHQPHPHGPTSATNQDPFCRRHHRGNTLCTMTGCRPRPTARTRAGARQARAPPRRNEGADSGRQTPPRQLTFAWLACIRDDHGVDWTMPDAEHYRCTDEPLPTGMAA